MKEEAVLKINKIGKVSSVFALIGKIVVGIGLAFMLVATIAMFCVPKDLLVTTVEEKVDFAIDLSSIGVELSEEDRKEAMESMKEDEDFSEEGTFTGEVTEKGIYLEGQEEIGSFDFRDFAVIMCIGTLSLILLMVSLCYGSALCKSFRDCQSPFEVNVITKMRNFAFSLIPWALFSTLSQSVSDSILNNKVSVNFVVDLGIILVVLVVFLLVYIFQYGAVLQQESDETL